MSDTAWEKYDKKELKKLDKLCDGYKAFLSKGKTERECVRLAVDEAIKAGYENLDDVISNGKILKSGDKVYKTMMDKTVAFFNIGDDDIEKGMAILGAHIDSPRLDLKQNPVYESEGMTFFDTHYYGGVKKYQWVTIPLAMHGVVAKKNGELIDVVIGEDEDDTVLCITDLLIHLSSDQLQKKGSVVVEGENLDVLVGNRPYIEVKKTTKNDSAEDKKKDKKPKDAVKKNILEILKKKYDFEEDDFLSAEFEIIPAGKARDCGIDASMVIGYGQDDRVCAYTSLVAMLEVDKVKRTTCTLLVDKEEIGSVGATGMRSKFFENTMADLLDAMGQYSELKLRRCLAASKMLSSDVSAAFDPLYASVFEKKNTAFFGKGMVFNKYTGSRGKSGSNDANPEFFAQIRKVLDDNEVDFQTAELGKVDIGGGGTIAYIMSLYGMQVIDAGIAVLSMHAPWEITSKADIYETKKGYVAFLKEI